MIVLLNHNPSVHRAFYNYGGITRNVLLHTLPPYYAYALNPTQALNCSGADPACASHLARATMHSNVYRERSVPSRRVERYGTSSAHAQSASLARLRSRSASTSEGVVSAPAAKASHARRHGCGT